MSREEPPPEPAVLSLKWFAPKLGAMNTQRLAEERRIFTCRAGSHAYGLNTATSDEDTRGVFVGSPSNVCGLFPVEHVEYHGDYMVYELRKFVSLAKDCNPNIIELLYIHSDDVLFSTPLWERLRDARNLFLTKRAKHTFSGYAVAQLKKIRSHKTWVMNPQPKEAPLPAKFVKRKYIEGLGHADVFDQLAYDTALKQWKQYWEWKENRNPMRAAMEEQSGYDLKHAMHLIRLLLMGREILQSEGVIVKRPDRDYLLSIRNGAFPYEDIVARSDELIAELETLYESSTLPKAPDVEKIDALLVSIYRDFWRERGEV